MENEKATYFIVWDEILSKINWTREDADKELKIQEKVCSYADIYWPYKTEEEISSFIKYSDQNF